MPYACSRGHWQINGGPYLVNYYPLAKGGPSFYVNGMAGGRKASDFDEVIAAVYEPPHRCCKGGWSRNGAAKRKKAYTQDKVTLLRKSPTCHWCGKQLTLQTATVDHVIPLSRGGSNGMDNVELACVKCNQDRGNRLPTESRSGARNSIGEGVRRLMQATGQMPYRDAPEGGGGASVP